LDKSKRFLGVLIVTLGLGGYLLAIHGKDPVTLAANQKTSILASEQLNVSFQGVGGKLIHIEVIEEKTVKKGDPIAALDTTDIDLAITKAMSDIENTKLKMNQKEDAIVILEKKLEVAVSQAEISLAQSKTTLRQTLDGARKEDIDKQKLAVEAAEAALVQQQRAYNQMLNLEQTYMSTANYSAKVHRDQIEAAKAQLTVMENGLNQQKTLLEKMINGPTAHEKEQAGLLEQKASSALEQTKLGQLDIDNQKLEIASMSKQLEQQNLALQSLRLQKQRMTLTAPADGKIAKVHFKAGENVPSGAPIVLLDTGTLYYDIYVDETQVQQFKVDGEVPTSITAMDQILKGKVRSINAAPQFANVRVRSEKGLSDLNSFQIRVTLNSEDQPSVLAGMTAEVKLNELDKK
jgi:HlyD family secretion protein